MFDDHTDALWWGLGFLAALAAAPGLLAGGIPLLPLFLAIAGLACAAHRPSRAFVLEKVGSAFSGSVLRTVAILAGALLMFQLLPFELALLMAGDVLAYVEVVAAVSLIAGRARWPLLKARVAPGLQAVVETVWRRPVARAGRVVARRCPRPSSVDDDGRGAAWGIVVA